MKKTQPKKTRLFCPSDSLGFQNAADTVPDIAVQCLESYLPHRQNHLEKLGIREESLFVNQDGGRLKGSSISRAVHAIARRGKIPRITNTLIPGL